MDRTVSTLELAADLCQVPADAIPTHGVTVIGYIEADGEKGYVIATHGQSDLSSIVGLLTRAAHRLDHELDGD